MFVQHDKRKNKMIIYLKILIFILFITINLQSGCSSSRDDAENKTTEKQKSVLAAELVAAKGNKKMSQLAYKEAGEYYQEAAELLPAGNDEILADYLNKAAKSFWKGDQYNEAVSLLKQVLAIREKILGQEHPDVASSLSNLAGLYKAQGDYEQAKPLYERALAIFEKVRGQGKGHPDVSFNISNLASNLAELHELLGNYAQAKYLYELSLFTFKEFFSYNPPNVRQIFSEKYNHLFLNYERLLSKMAEDVPPE